MCGSEHIHTAFSAVILFTFLIATVDAFSFKALLSGSAEGGLQPRAKSLSPRQGSLVVNQTEASPTAAAHGADHVVDTR